jgi:alpha 1,3-glucosidase
MEFPDDEHTFSMGDQFILGGGIVVKPVVKPDQKSVSVYLPRSSVNF